MTLDQLRTIAVGVAHHHLCQSVEKDELDFWVTTCSCGDVSNPFPALDDAVDNFAQHLASMVLMAVAEAL